MANACAGEQRIADEDILALYRRWRATRDPLFKRRLEAMGIYPLEQERAH